MLPDLNTTPDRTRLQEMVLLLQRLHQKVLGQKRKDSTHCTRTARTRIHEIYGLQASENGIFKSAQLIYSLLADARIYFRKNWQL
jgi:hypothetical protein